KPSPPRLTPRAPQPAHATLPVPATPVPVFPDSNPYQYTYTVTGDEFYGRRTELQQLKRCLQQGIPLTVIGLQRTGKSSLVMESIRRLCQAAPYYHPIIFDFRSIRSESPQPEQDLTLEFVRSFASEIGDSELGKVVTEY